MRFHSFSRLGASLLVAIVATQITACGESDSARDDDATVQVSSDDGSVNESEPRRRTRELTAEEAEEQTELSRTLDSFPDDPRVVFDRTVTSAFKDYRGEQRKCRALPEKSHRNDCLAIAKDAYREAMADAKQARDQALASAPPSG